MRKSARKGACFTRKCMTYARFYRKRRGGEKTPTLLRRGENFGRTGEGFSMVIALICVDLEFHTSGFHLMEITQRQIGLD